MLRSENEASRGTKKQARYSWYVVSTLLALNNTNKPLQPCDKEMQMTYDEVITMILREKCNLQTHRNFQESGFQPAASYPSLEAQNEPKVFSGLQPTGCQTRLRFDARSHWLTLASAKELPNHMSQKFIELKGSLATFQSITYESHI